MKAIIYFFAFLDLGSDFKRFKRLFSLVVAVANFFAPAPRQ
jgi:hypothetical protein